MRRAGGKDSHLSTCATQTILRHTREHLSRGTQTLDPDGSRLCLFDMPPKQPHSNQVASAPITVPPRRNDTDQTLSSAATAEMDDVLFGRGGDSEPLDSRRRPRGNCVGHTSRAAKQRYPSGANHNEWGRIENISGALNRRDVPCQTRL